VPKALVIPKNWSAADIPDLTGKKFLITGATSGIGLAAATQLARRNAHVYITARSVEKARVAIKQIGKDQIKDRLVVVSSFAHRMGNFGDNSIPTIKNMMLGIGKYQKWQVYGASKLANLLFVSELERLRIQNNWSFIPIAVHPGYSDTNLQTVASQMRGAAAEEKITKLINKLLAQPAAAGALPTLAAAVYPGLYGASFIGPDGFLEIKGAPKVTRARALAYDQVLAKNLWQVSEELTKVSWA